MILKPGKDGVFTVSFLLAPEYAMVCLLSAIEPMRLANRFLGREAFRWQLLSENGYPVYASNDMALSTAQSMSEIPPPSNLFVCSSYHPENLVSEKTISGIKELHRKGSVLGAMDTGCYLLAAANVLKDRRFTLHWEAVPAFQEDYPGLTASNEVFEIDGNLITCSGGTAAIDMMLHIIEVEFGHDITIAVCEQLIKSGVRQKSDKQRINLAARLQVHDPRLLRVLVLMEENLESPLTLMELADNACLSVRQLERLFSSNFDCSPSHYYLDLRLKRAKQLLKESHLSVTEVAIACGFNSSAHFTRAYSKEYQVSPSKDRGHD